MAIRADSYGSLAEVAAFFTHNLDGESTLNSTTVPTATQVEKFIDRASGILNLAIVDAGLSDSSLRSNSTAKLSCDDWVVARAAEYAEVTRSGVGFTTETGTRVITLRNISKSAREFVMENKKAWKFQGITQTHRDSEGLSFTGLDSYDQRDDPDDTTLRQPLFRRQKFDVHFDDDGDDEEDY